MLGVAPDCILKVVKPLYSVFKTENYWFAIYHSHHINKLGMKQSTYNPCLLYRSDPLGIIGLQTDNTLLLANNTFANAEEKAIKHAKLMSKDQDYLTINKSIKFNEALIELTSDSNLTLKQK